MKEYVRFWLALFIVLNLLLAFGIAAIYTAVCIVTWQIAPAPWAEMTAVHWRGFAVAEIAIPTILSMCLE